MNNLSFENIVSKYNTPIKSLCCRKYEVSSYVAPEFLNDIVSCQVFQGYLVGVTDGDYWGWWGPISKEVCALVENFYKEIQCNSSANPLEWVIKAYLAKRHYHSGIGSCAIGAFELAIWDLIGQREGSPIWALFVNTPKRTSQVSYASCLGRSLSKNSSLDLSGRLDQAYVKVQKWRPPSSSTELSNLNCIIDNHIREGVAIDFGGKWAINKVNSFLSRLNQKLAWIEEPLPPWQMQNFADLNPIYPCASGEYCYGPHDTAILETPDIDIWQPDAVFCGGFSNFFRIAKRAERVGKRCIPHGGGLVPALHAAFIGAKVEMIEWHLDLEPLRLAHWNNPPRLTQSFELEISDCPGWCGTLNPNLSWLS